MYACCWAARSGSPAPARAARTAPTYVIGRPQPTSRSRRCSSWRAGSSVTPPCTGPGWRTVLRGALRKPNRWPSDWRAASPARSSPRQTQLDEGQRLAHLVDVDAGVQGAQPVGVDVAHDVEEVGGLAVQDDADVEELLAVGSRHAAQHDVLVGHALIAAPPGSHWRVPRRARRKSTYAARSASGRRRRRGTGLEPHVGHVGEDLGEDRRGRGRRRSRRRARGRGRRRSRRRGRSTSHGWAANFAGSVTPGAPAVVEVERGAVVDHPEVAVPEQEVGVAPRAVDVGGEGVEPQHPGALVVGGADLAVDPERAGQEVDAEVGADAGVEQVLHLLVGLVARQLGVEVEHDEPRGAQPEPGGQPADDHLGDQHLARPGRRRGTCRRRCPRSSPSTTPGRLPPSRNGVT